MKKFLSFFLVIVLALSLTGPVMAEGSTVGVEINGKQVQFTQSSGSPFIDSANRTQVPLRATMEAYGCKVDWNNDTRTAIVSKDGTEVRVPIGAKYIEVNGETVATDTSAIIKDSRTYLPIRPVLESFGGYVSWNSSTKSVSVDSTSQLVQVHFLNVGQGDSILIDAGTYEVLIDASTSDAGVTVVSDIKPYVDGNLDLVIATHPDSDHIGGMPNVFNSYTVSEVIDSGRTSSTSTYTKYWNCVGSEGCKYLEDDNFTLSLGTNINLKVIETGDNASNNNDSSVVCELVYGNCKVLFTGDMSSSVENSNLSLFEDVDVLKVGHHGSRTSTSAEFLNIIKPEYAVISCGTDNSYGHPTSETLSRLSSAGTKVLGTFKSGDIVLSTNGKEYNLNKSNYLSLSDAGAGASANTGTNTGNSGSSGSSSGNSTSNTVTASYIGNSKTMKFHYSTCSSVAKMNASNKVALSSREAAISQGYTPCGNCNP